MNNSDAHFPASNNLSMLNQFQSAWKKLNSSQKGTLISVFVLALMLPIAIFASYFQNNMSSRAASKPGTYMATPVVNQGIKFPNEEANNSYLVTPPDPQNNAPNFTTGNPFTIEAWVKIPKPISGTYIRNYTLLMLTKPQTPTDYGYIYRLTLETQETTGTTRPIFSALKNTFDYTNKNYISVGGGNTVSINPDSWAHLAVTSYSENDLCNLKLYLNGIQVDSAQVYAPKCQISIQQPQKLFIAKYPDGAGGIDGYYYPGAVDELRISNSVRYAQNFSPPTTPFESDNSTVGLWHFNGDTIDASNHAHTFTVNGPVNYIEASHLLPTPTPALTISPPITIIMCTPPACRPGEVYYCSGVCTGGCGTQCVTPTPAVKPSITPSTTPIPTTTNRPPVIVSTFLPKGQVNRPFNAIISGTDQDTEDTLQMDITNLPPGITQGQCQTTKSGSVKYMRCLIKGLPTLSGIYPVNVRLADNHGGVANKILNLTIINPK